jgi:DNA-binding response OmpR family regulator
MRILLVEDDLLLADGLSHSLSREGHVIRHVQNKVTALTALQRDEYDVVLLDLGLPDGDGMQVLEKIRSQQKDVRVLILTARGDGGDKIKGLDGGADDYLVKPFDIDELKARLRVLTRRQQSRHTDALTIGAVTIFPSSHEVETQGQRFSLPRREFALLEKLMINAGKIVTREQAERALYHWNEDLSSNALEVHIHHLRKKLGASYIRTVRGVGYSVQVS